MSKTILINGKPCPISSSNETYTQMGINADETPLVIAQLKRELENKMYTMLCQERMQTSKNLEWLQQKTERLETIVNQLENEVRTLNVQLSDIQGAIQRGKIVL